MYKNATISDTPCIACAMRIDICVMIKPRAEKSSGGNSESSTLKLFSALI